MLYLHKTLQKKIVFKKKIFKYKPTCYQLNAVMNTPNKQIIVIVLSKWHCLANGYIPLLNSSFLYLNITTGKNTIFLLVLSKYYVHSFNTVFVL